MEKILQVGAITQTHGVRGEVKVFPTTDDPRRFKKLKEVILDTGKEMLPLEIESVKFFKQFVILKFKGIDNINDVEQYKKKNLYVTRENAVKCRRDEYFIADLIGLKVYEQSEIELDAAANDASDEVSDVSERKIKIEDAAASENYLGEIKDVIVTGANDVYLVESDQYGEIMIPAIKDCILDVDIEEGKMKVHLLPGLLELNS